MSSDRKKPEEQDVVDLARSRDRLQVKRQDRAAAQLAARFHGAMGWEGTPGTKRAKKPKRKKK